MKILILGGSGMLGHKLSQVIGAESNFEVHVTVRALPAEPFRHASVRYHTGVDLEQGINALDAVLKQLAPDVVINAVGAIKQKDLLSSIEGTFFINGVLPHIIPLINPNKNSRVVHFSTDCVYRGDEGHYTEADSPDAEDVYGRSKACGEIDYGQHLTIRTSIVGFEVGGHLSLLSWLFRQPPRSTLHGFRRAIYSGVPTCTLARTVVKILHSHPELRGLYHVASEPITKFDLISRVNDAFELDHALIPDDTVVIDRSLNDAKFRTATGLPRPDWDALVDELLIDFHTLPYSEIYNSMAQT